MVGLTNVGALFRKIVCGGLIKMKGQMTVFLFDFCHKISVSIFVYSSAYFNDYLVQRCLPYFY